jgi:hypothetical protein
VSVSSNQSKKRSVRSVVAFGSQWPSTPSAAVNGRESRCPDQAGQLGRLPGPELLVLGVGDQQRALDRRRGLGVDPHRHRRLEHHLLPIGAEVEALLVQRLALAGAVEGEAVVAAGDAGGGALHPHVGRGPAGAVGV